MVKHVPSRMPKRALASARAHSALAHSIYDEMMREVPQEDVERIDAVDRLAIAIAERLHREYGISLSKRTPI